MARRIMLVFGTRPEAIKLAPVIRALRSHRHLEPVVVVTAQHRSMLDQVLQLFDIRPDHDLDLMSERQTLAGLTARMIDRVDPVIGTEAPDMVVVQGDTTSTFVGGLVAHYHRVPVAHVEAGLRTGDRYAPFPEEANRRLVGQLAALHLPATDGARHNLLQEGVDAGAITVTGNTVVDALQWAVARRAPYGDAALAGIDEDPRRVLLVTAHRRESWGGGMEGIGAALGRVARRWSDVLVVFPIHRNPVVREAILPALEGLPNVVVVEPVAYGALARLLDRCHLVLTDSGGIQEEAPSLGKPVLVMRDTTERPEGLAAGTARLVGTDPDRIVEAVSGLLSDEAAYRAMARAVNPYGDGRAAERVVQAIAAFFGAGTPPEEFSAQLAGLTTTLA